jgi:chitin disaccharide deacetylase
VILLSEFLPPLEASNCSCNFIAAKKNVMKIRLLFLLLMCAVLFTACAQNRENGPRLIVRGDDMGFSHSGNEALIKAYKEGIETSIEVIVPSPWFPEAVKLLEENPGVDVGVHIALTSEWDNVKYRPVSVCPSLIDEDGYFFPFIRPNKDYPKRALSEQAWKIQDIENEMRAQIELALKRIPRISHITAHMGCYYMTPEVTALAKKLAIEYKIDIEPEALGAKGIGYGGPKGTTEEKIKSFITMLESLEPGKTYYFVDHPGIDTPELRAIHHIGYENVAADRQGVTDTWTSATVKETIRKKGIQLISYKDLKPK